MLGLWRKASLTASSYHKTYPYSFSPSQLARQGPAALADALTENLRINGDLNYMNPAGFDSSWVIWPCKIRIHNDMTLAWMMMATKWWKQLRINHNLLSHYCYSFVLFVLIISSNADLRQSQTQSGRRYTPTLTRFYASLPPQELMQVIHASLLSLGVTCKLPGNTDQSDQSSLRLRIGGYDTKKLMFKGWVEVESFTYRGHHGSFCMMQRDVVSSLSCIER